MSNPISNMVNRFLCWKLPKDFGPDAGITFNKYYPFESPHWPIGTNLLTATQAEEMLRHCVGEEINQLRAENAALKAELAEAKKDAELVDACHEFINSPISVESCERFNKTLEARKGK